MPIDMSSSVIYHMLDEWVVWLASHDDTTVMLDGSDE